MNIWSQMNENGEQRRLLNEGLNSLCRSSNIVRVIKSRRLRWARHVVRMEQDRNAFSIFFTGKRLPRRPRRRWEDNILEWILKK